MSIVQLPDHLKQIIERQVAKGRVENGPISPEASAATLRTLKPTTKSWQRPKQVSAMPILAI